MCIDSPDIDLQTHTPRQVHKSDVHAGDHLLVKTRNSTYIIRVVAEDQYQISGGWFNRNQTAPALTTIEGCGWRGHVLHPDLVAAEGLSLTFGNRIATSPVQEIQLLSAP